MKMKHKRYPNGKLCTNCKQLFPEDGFYWTKGYLKAICKECESKIRRGKHPNHKGRKERRIVDPKKRKSQNILRGKVRQGFIEKPFNCSCCGEKTEKSKLAGHHFNGYENPLDVVWLCSYCHHKAHKQQRAA
jgi:hypothetical protein